MTPLTEDRPLNWRQRHINTMRLAIDMWGHEIQIDMLVGEIGELLTLFGRQAQGRAELDDWLDEIADVHMLLMQLSIMKGIKEDEINERINQKMTELRGRIYKDKES